MQEFAGRPVRVFVVWEPVLPTDWTRPSSSTLGRIPDPRAVQLWDRGRLISRAMGEHDRRSVVWDHIEVYKKGALWKGRPPEALYRGGPVVRVIGPARSALAEALQGISSPN